MDRVALGYTVVEVMIVLGITAVIFLSAITVFNSQRGPTDFSQSMQDLNSTIQSYANRVTSSTYPGSDAYGCSVGGNGRAVLTNGAAQNNQCIFLGLGILAPKGQSNLQVYTVLGNRENPSGTDLSNTIAEALPEPAILNSGGSTSYALTDSYQLGAGSTILSAKSNGSELDLLGMYNGLPGDPPSANSSGTGALELYGYDCNGANCSSTSPSIPGVKSCIEDSSPCTIFSRLSNPWQLCIQDGRSQNTALLTLSSAPGGIITKLSFQICS